MIDCLIKFFHPFASASEVRGNIHRFSMGNLVSSKFLFFLFQFLYVQLKASDYAVPDYYFINCGSSESTIVYGRKFVGDENPDSFTLSAPSTIVFNNTSTDSSSSSLYGTARTFRKPSWYEFNIDQSGIYVVRFHFYAFTASQAQGTELYNARFNVSASDFTLLSDFHVQNSTSTSNSPLIKEFLLNIAVGKFKINFIPSGSSSTAFINAIETFLAPDSFIPHTAPPYVTPAGHRQNDYDGLLSDALRVIHRINVGGDKVTPENDTMGRIWVPDDEYLLTFLRDAARNNKILTELNYEPEWATKFDAPNPVYTTAKVLNNSSTQPTRNINASWRFNVSQQASFLVRAHFCDIVRNASTDGLQFKLYIYTDFGYLVDLLDKDKLSVPFFFDCVVDSDESGFMNISIGQVQSSENKMAFLNGLEIMELISSSRSKGNEASKKLLYVIIGSVFGGVVLIIVSVKLFWSCLRLRKAKHVETLNSQLLNLNRGSSYSRSTENNVNGSPLPDLNLSLKIAFGEVLYATRNFHKDLLIGEGGFGKVYRGTLSNGTKVAIKRSEPGRKQGLQEFQTEIVVLTKIRHRHLVSLIGYCDESSEMILVYEFMDKGTLREHLYGSKQEPTETTSDTRLSWEKRLELCIDAANGLNYLHTGLGGAIIHRDVKSTNILLDEHYVAKVADFGISRLGAPDETHVSTEVKGTFGYLDPEYFKCQILTQKSDVYSFGVVLLEVLCARRAIDNSLPREQVNLADWGMSCITKGELEMIVDPLLKGKINPNSLERFVLIVQKCLQECGTDRPNMIDVSWDLKYALQLQHTAPPTQPHEDSNTDVSYNLPLPVVARLPSNSIVISEDEDGMDSGNALFNGSNTSE